MGCDRCRRRLRGRNCGRGIAHLPGDPGPPQRARHGQNTREQRAAARESVLDAFFRWRALAADPGLARIFLAGSEDLSSVAREDRFRFGLLIEEFLLVNERLFARAREGTGEIPSHVAVQAVSRLLEKPGARQWWNENAELFSPGFRSAVLEATGPRGTGDRG